ncbi:MAG TPA: hypothetical protein VJ861_10680 [Treponemataceae bacterium]|nr:hypothetical protein [Treponemataceae bacterium]
MITDYIPNFAFIDDEEKELRSLDPSTALPEAEKQAAIEDFKKASSDIRKSVTMRLAESTITGLKARAEADGIPYQTLASMILQKYVRGNAS